MIVDELKRDLPSLPFLETFQKYNKDKLLGDSVSGLTVALLAIPQCMAYALIVGLPPVYGLYAGIAGAIFGALFGSSDYHITGPTGTIAVVISGIIIGFRPSGYSLVSLATILSVLVGLIQLSFSLLKIGNLAQFVSISVMNGFITGSALVIMGDQLGTILKLQGSNSPYFFSRLLRQLMEIAYKDVVPYLSIGLAVGAILLTIILRLIDDRLPAILISTIVGGIIAYFFQLGHHGVELVGALNFQLPTIPEAGFQLDVVFDLFGPALAVALLSSVQALTVAGSLAESAAEDLDENQELLGQGVANIFSGLLRGFPVSGSFTRSFLNYNLGARTRLSSVFSGLCMVVLLGIFTPMIYYVPLPVLAGLVIVIAFDILDWEKITHSLTITRRDRTVFLGTVLSVFLLKLDYAIYLGIVVSLMLHLRKATQPDMKELIVDRENNLKTIHAAAERIQPQIAFIDLTGEAFFGSARPIKSRVKKLREESPELKVIILRMKNAMNLDITAVNSLVELANQLREEGRTLMICGATPHIQELFDETGATEEIGADKIFVAQKTLLESTKRAMQRAREHIDNVLTDKKDRDEESPTLTHTMAQGKEETDALDSEEPIEEEKTGFHESYDEEG